MSDTIYRQTAIEKVRKCRVIEVTPAHMLIDKAEVMTELMMLPSAQSKKFSEVLRDMMDKDYYLFCHTGYSRLAEKDWEWLIEQAEEIEQSEKEN